MEDADGKRGICHDEGLESPAAAVEGALLLDVLGSRSKAFRGALLAQLDDVMRARSEGHGESPDALNAGLAIMGAVSPGNELEAALAVQIAGTFALSIELLGKARHAEDMDRLSTFAELAVKVQRLSLEQLETLSKIRTRGKQVVEVVHIHKQVNVAPGAQAIVGDVYRGGGGGIPQIDDQPHTPCQVGAQVRSEDAPRAALSCASDPRPKALPNARGNEPGRAERAG